MDSTNRISYAWYFVMIAAAVFFVGSIFKPLVTWSFSRTDLEICLNAARNLVHHQLVYNPNDLWEHTKPPLATLLFVPLQTLPLGVVQRLWDLLNLSVLFGLSFYLSTWTRQLTSRIPTWFLPIAGVLLVTNFWFYELRFGQYNLLGLALVIAGARSKNVWIAGFSLAVASVLKPTNVIFAPWVLGIRRKPLKLLATSACGLLFLSAVYALAFGFHSLVQDHLDWLAFLPQATQKYLFRGSAVGFGLPQVFAHFSSSSAFQNGFLLAGVLLSALCVWKISDPLKSLSFVCLLCVACSPMTWWANFVYLLPVSLWTFHLFLEEWIKGKIPIQTILMLFLLILGTQLIYPATLPRPLMDAFPFAANPLWPHFVLTLLMLWKWPPKFDVGLQISQDARA